MININPLFTNAFKFTIDRGDDKLEIFCQATGLPGMKLNNQPQPTTLGVQIPVAVNTLNFDPLTIEFTVDQNLDNWKSLYDWVKSIGNISDDTSSTSYQTWATSAYLEPLDYKSCPIPARTIKFHYVIPRELGGIAFKADLNDPTPVRSRAVFDYSYYSFE